MTRHTDAVIVGGGIIGLATAWRLRAHGLSVTVCDREPGAGATYAAAGMLAPVAEARWGDERLLPLALESLRIWPDFATDLTEASGLDLDLHADGILIAGCDADDRRILEDLLLLHTRHDLAAHALSGREARALEPALTPALRGGVLARSDMAVDPRRVVHALLASLDTSGVRVVRAHVASVARRGDAVHGVVLEDGTRLDTGAVVLAAGAATPSVGGLPAGTLPPVRPVKGQILRLRGEPLLTRPVQGFVHGSPVYLVPRTDGELVVGATQEEMGVDTRVTARAVYELLRDAIALVPDVGELELCETTVGFRPGTPDNLPHIGPTEVDGLLVATGHHRNGILLAPVTAAIMVSVLAGEHIPPEFLPYAPTWPVRRAPVVVPT